MSKFQLTIGQQNMAGQIANLINSGRQLYVFLTPESIIRNKIEYLLELNGDTIIGVVGLEKHNPRVTEIKHLVVHPNYRRQGLGRKMLEKAVSAAQTEFVYGLVRNDNPTNLRNNVRIGMRPIGKTPQRKGHRLIIFAKRKRINLTGGYER